MSRRGSKSAPQPPASAATSGAGQLRFLEELSSLLRPEPRPERAERGPPIPPAGQLARTRPARASVGRGACPAGRERRTSGTISSSDLPDPRDYLNSAELLLLTQRKTTPHAAAQRRKPVPLSEADKREKSAVETKRRGRDASRSLSLAQPSLPRTRRRSGSLSNCWLKETKEKNVREWLRKKESESASRKLAENRERRQEKRKREEKVRQQAEREQLAMAAYQQWKQRKTAEDKVRGKVKNARDKQVQILTEENSSSHQPQGYRSIHHTPHKSSRQYPAASSVSEVARQATSPALQPHKMERTKKRWED